MLLWDHDTANQKTELKNEARASFVIINCSLPIYIRTKMLRTINECLCSSARLYKTLFFLLSFCLILEEGLKAQQSDYVSLQPIPPSPDGAKLAQFELTPTNLYTGSQNLSVPIYDIQFDGVSIPIKINYHSGGVRASENSSSIGLGWALVTGGSISRTVKGLNDLHAGNGFAGYCHDTTPIPESLQNWTGVDWIDPYWSSYLRGLVDTEPDIFTYSFLNTSGKFILSKAIETNNVIQVIKLVDNTDKIEFNLSSLSFTVTTADGIQGIFSVKEYVTTVSGSNSNGNWTACDGQYVDILQTINQGGRAITTWYLSQIIGASGRTINYAYDIKANGYSDYLSVSSKSWGEVKSVNATVAGFADEIGTQTCSRIITEHVYLSSISSTDLDLQITFTKGDRDDLEKLDPANFTYNSWINVIKTTRNESTINVLKPQRLMSIQIRNISASSTLNTVTNFNQTYFGIQSPNNYDNLRLKLNDVKSGKLISGQFTADQVHKFLYNDGLPNKSTLGVDYWGFYNGMDGNTAITPVLVDYPPNTLIAISNSPQNYYFQTPNRAANFDYGKAGLLTKVTYPTGGYTLYEYESNEYKLEGKEHVPITGSTTYSVSGLTSDQTVSFGYKGYGFDGCSGMVSVSMSTKCKDFYLGNNCTIASGDVNKVAVELIGPDASVKKDLRYDIQWGLGVNNYVTNTDYNTNPINGINFAGGTYILKGYGIKVAGATQYYGDATITIPNKCLTSYTPTIVDLNRNQKAGGARVKSITMFDLDNRQLLKRSYQYASPDQGGTFSSGRLMNPLMNMAYRENPASTAGNLYWLFTSGSSIANGNAAQGNHVGYSYVRENIEDASGANNGIRDHYFINEPNYLAPWSMSNQAAITNLTYEEINGSLDLQSISSGTNSSISSTDYTNYYFKSGNINAIKVNWHQLGPGALVPNLHSFYKINRGHVEVREIISSQYFSYNAATQTIVTKETRTYNGLNQLIGKDIKNGNNEIITSQLFKYPSDYGGFGSAIIQSMVTKNIIAPVIETKTSKKVGTQYPIVGARGNKFRIDNNKVVLDKTYQYNKDLGTFSSSNDGSTFPSPYEEVTSIVKYDSKANLLEVLGKDGVSTSYIWGYNQQYPVAKLIGITRLQVEAILGANYNSGTGGMIPATVTQLRNAFPGAQISIYTYNVGVGIATTTDANGSITYYDYDTLGRLMAIKDSNGKLLKTFQYHVYEQN